MAATPQAEGGAGVTAPARLRHVDGLRAVAILLVLVFHLAPELAPGGFVGVDVFFVISGYVITLGLARERAGGVASFYAKRVRRLFPALVVVLASTWAAGAALLIPTAFAALGRHVLSGAAFAANLRMWSESGYFDADVLTKPLAHLWSLGVEEQFYLTWPWLFLALRPDGRRGLSALAALALGSLAWAAWHATSAAGASAAFYAPWARFWELAAGCGLGGWHASGRASEDARGGWLAGAGLCAVLGAGTLGVGGGGAGLATSFVGTAGTFAVLAASASTGVARALATGPCVFVGELSYPLYLWHWPLLSYAVIVSHHPPEWLSRVGLGLASLGLAWVTTRFVERPVRARPAGPSVVLPWSAALVSVALLGAWTSSREGFPERLPPEVRALAVDPNPSNGSPPSWRQAEGCFQKFDGDPTPVGPSCTGSARPLVALWGDSEAAALFSGLKAVADAHGLGLSQYTASMCPPSLSTQGAEGCVSFNQLVLDTLSRTKPDVVVLHSFWIGSTDGVPDLVRALKARGVGQVIVVGPVPHWQVGLPNVVLEYAKLHPTAPLIPERTWFGIGDAGREDPGVALRGAVLAQSALYVSAWDAMCTTDGCLTRVGVQTGDLTAFDFAHLTEAGAAVVGEAIAPTLLSALPAE